MIHRNIGRHTVRSRAVAPGPRGRPIVGSLLDIQKDPATFLVRARRRYGDVVRVRLAHKHAFLVAHPDDVKYVLQENNHNYKKGAHYESIRAWLGNGLLVSDGDFWFRQRKIMQPGFHRQHLGAFAQTMTDQAERMLDRWRPYAERGRPIEIAQEMVRLTLSVVCKTLFSTDLSEDTQGVGAANAVALKWAEHRVLSLVNLPVSWPLPENLAFRKAHQVLNTAVDQLITERRDSGPEHADILSMLMQVRDEETGEGMTDVQLRDEVMNLLLAGHETPASTLAWSLYLLSMHTDVERRLHRELAEVLGGRTPSFDDLPNLKYTVMVLEETMRLYPPVWIVERDAIEDDEIHGYYVPAGSMVAMSQFVTHRHPDFWENPEGFDPERFEPEKAHDRHRFAYFPFGGGPRLCLGSNYAMMEMPLLLATIAQRYRLELVSGHPVEMEPVITLRPKHGILMTLRPRTTE